MLGASISGICSLHLYDIHSSPEDIGLVVSTKVILEGQIE